MVLPIVSLSHGRSMKCLVSLLQLNWVRVFVDPRCLFFSISPGLLKHCARVIIESGSFSIEGEMQSLGKIRGYWLFQQINKITKLRALPKFVVHTPTLRVLRRSHVVYEQSKLVIWPWTTDFACQR